MKSILPPIPVIASVCGKQRIRDCDYVTSQYCVRQPCGEGELLYNSLTGELLLLEQGEKAEDFLEALIAKRYLVPSDFDEFAYAAQLKQFLEMTRRPQGSVNEYLIFTTTDCNARCYYCYELGRKRIPMSDETAKAAAEFIRTNASGDEIKLRWFGGEPLFNRRAIEIICAGLQEHGVAFQSQMTSNGYLFDEETVRIAKEEWHLNSVQISLDGTESVYNRAKAYIYREESAFQRVLRNIGLLLEAGIRVDVRLNTDRSNWEDQMALTEELEKRFGGRENINVYPALLQDYGGEYRAFRSRQEMLEIYRKLRERVLQARLAKPFYLPRKRMATRCMADNDRSLTILPNGMLSKCEHESERDYVGSLSVGITDEEMIESWRERVSVPACETCVFYPSCLDLKKCAGNRNGCGELDRELKQMKLEERIRNTYEYVKNRAADGGKKPTDAGDDELC